MGFKIGNNIFEKPIILAPMDGYTDIPFRTIIKDLGADIIYTEFAHSDALLYENEKTQNKTKIMEYERPVVIQIFGKKPENMAIAAKLMEKNNPDYLDLNFGCPSPTVSGNGSGAALLKDLSLLEEICHTVKEAVSIPVTAKTRIGWDFEHINILEVAKIFERSQMSAITLHPRTKSQKFKGSADWSYIKLLKENTYLPVIGNGDIKTPEDAKKMFDDTGCDGVMIGREAISNPWIFKQVKEYMETGSYQKEIPIDDKISLCIKHFDLSVKFKGSVRATFEMRKLFSYYFKGIPNIKRFKKLCFATTDVEKLRDYIRNVDKIINDSSIDKLELEPIKSLKDYYRGK
ncbi:MAG: tRNA dihydrouridine synthase DusB [Candidatus Cloacimonadota bacterium]|nr:MAG: tRNA dihydrouridine synthase DusB [Candidatus Cloacimonadota bacterium]